MNFFWQNDALSFSGPDDATTGGCDGGLHVMMLVGHGPGLKSDESVVWILIWDDPWGIETQ